MKAAGWGEGEELGKGSSGGVGSTVMRGSRRDHGVEAQPCMVEGGGVSRASTPSGAHRLTALLTSMSRCCGCAVQHAGHPQRLATSLWAQLEPQVPTVSNGTEPSRESEYFSPLCSSAGLKAFTSLYHDCTTLHRRRVRRCTYVL